MDINFNKIALIYGNDMITSVKENIDEVGKNIKYMIDLGFDDIEDIFEREVPLFINDSIDFKKKIDCLINKIGPDYVNEIENNLSLLEDLL